MSAIMYGTRYKNADGEDTVLPAAAPAASESKLTHIINHIKEYKLLYIGLIVVGSIVVYKKFIAKK
jgi:hypothetical protein